jgi:hypothetical protein
VRGFNALDFNFVVILKIIGLSIDNIRRVLALVWGDISSRNPIIVFPTENQHIVLESSDDIENLRADLLHSLVLFTGPRFEEKRTSGIPLAVMDKLLSLADEHQYPLIIEADGARKKPIKAPSETEPVIPDRVTSVVVVCGLSGIGKPFSSRVMFQRKKTLIKSSLRPSRRLARWTF